MPQLYFIVKKDKNNSSDSSFSFIESSDKIILFQGVPPSLSALWPENQTFCFRFSSSFLFLTSHILSSSAFQGRAKHVKEQFLFFTRISQSINFDFFVLISIVSAGTSYIVSIVAKNSNGDSEPVVLTVTTR